ncbi:MAG: PIN domain-containing protein [Planctomycetes bacterium]|nr:PIN domain-containing protein [Planctomycetota bacterium]
MIAVDTNLLVYAHREDSAWHAAADRCVTGLAESGRDWAIPWPCIHEFLAITTHPKIFSPPTPLADALEQVSCWLECPTLVLIGEAPEYWPILSSVLRSGKIIGPRIHDARVAAICQQHGIEELWSADRDFGRVTGLAVRNPLV